jgi:hypothetical protein
MPRKKSPLTPPGIDPGTFRLVAQCLNHYVIQSPPPPKKNIQSGTSKFQHLRSFETTHQRSITYQWELLLAIRKNTAENKSLTAGKTFFQSRKMPRNKRFTTKKNMTTNRHIDDRKKSNEQQNPKFKRKCALRSDGLPTMSTDLDLSGDSYKLFS